MEQGEVEVLFCDLCGTSVSQGDVGAGRASQRHGKTVGACCLTALRGEAAVGAASALAPAPRTPAAPAEGRVTLVAVLVAVAALATALFVDQRLTEVSQGLNARLDQQAESMKSDSQVVARMALDLDSVPRRADTDALMAAAAKAEEFRADLSKRLDDLATAAAGVARQQEATVDYRPLLEDLRQRQVRILEQLGAVRAAAPAAPIVDAKPAPSPVDAPAPEVVAPAPAAPPVTPAAFAEQAKKLASADPAVRFEGVDDLICSKSAEAVPLLLPMTRDADPFVRRLVVEGFASWKRADVVDALLGGLVDGDEYVRDTAWRSLREVTGQKIPFEAAGGKDARARAVARWQEWWEKNKATFGA